MNKGTGSLLGSVSAKEQKSIKNRFSQGNVLFGKLRPYLRKYAQPNFDGVCSSEIWVFSGKTVNNDFLYRLIQTDYFMSAVSSTSGSKMPRAEWDLLKNLNFGYPKNTNEQQKIANFLSAVDDKITALTAQKTALTQYKQGMMQRIFAQTLRFKDDNGADYPEWEVKYLKNVSAIYDGTHMTPDYQASGVNWLDWDESIRTRAFKSEPVGEVWGIGYRISASLNDMGIQTVWDFVRADAATLRKRFGVVVERTQRELQGIPCADLEVQIADKQQIVRSRSFGKPVCDIEGLRASLAFHIAEAASELRAQNSTANLIGVMLRTNPFKPEEPQYKGYLTACLPVGSSDTLKLNRVVQQTLTQIYKSGYAYKKCGVVLMGIESANTQMQLDWLNPPDSDERKSLMHTIDALNQRFGRHSIRTADQDAAGNNAGWRMKRERLSPCYTTQFAQLLQVG